MSKIIKFLATGFGTGYAPIIPGTIGTLPAVAMAYFFDFNLYIIIVIALLGLYICHEAEKLFVEHDPSKVVFDEIAGFLVASFLIPTNSLWLAFIAFRFFDMIKPYPINKLQELPGGLGVMVDDLAAGLVANILVKGIIFIIPMFY